MSENGSGDADSCADESGNDSEWEWHFHEELELVLHDLNRCRMCDEFALHCSDARIRLHPSYHRACSARKLAIAKSAQESFDCRWSEQEEFKKTIAYLQRVLEGVRREMKAARVTLEEVRRELGEARRDRAAARGLYSSESKSSQRPRASRSPSPRPCKLPRRVSEMN